MTVDRVSLFDPKNHLLPFALSGHRTFFAVFADVLFLSLNGRKLFLLDLASLFDRLRQMSMAPDPPYLGHVRISPDQSLVVF